MPGGICSADGPVEASWAASLSRRKATNNNSFPSTIAPWEERGKEMGDSRGEGSASISRGRVRRPPSGHRGRDGYFKNSKEPLVHYGYIAADAPPVK